MDDEKIVALYWSRDERAIRCTDEKYGAYCGAIAYRILGNHEDADESVSDTYLHAWNSIPPTRPGKLSLFLGRLTRNLAIDRKRKNDAQKRGGSQYDVALEELEYCLSSQSDPEQALIGSELSCLIGEFLSSLPAAQRRVFIRRYWHFCSVQEIAQQYGYSLAKTKSMLFRTRNALAKFLTERGVHYES